MYLNKRIRSFRYAFIGIRIAWREEANFRFEVGCAIAALVLSVLLGVSRTEFTIILLAIGLVLVAETLNIALEEFCDMVKKSEHDPHVAKIKDLAAGAVFLAGWTAFGTHNHLQPPVPRRTLSERCRCRIPYRPVFLVAGYTCRKKSGAKKHLK